MNFLVIDDDKTFRDATCLMIEDEGHLAQPAASGSVALEILKADPCDAVLLDVKLGVENGLDVLQLILKQHPALPVVMFTVEGTVKTAVEASARLRGGCWCPPGCWPATVTVVRSSGI